MHEPKSCTTHFRFRLRFFMSIASSSLTLVPSPSARSHQSTADDWPEPVSAGGCVGSAPPVLRLTEDEPLEPSSTRKFSTKEGL